MIGNNASLEELKNLKAPPLDKKGSYYREVTHSSLIEEVIQSSIDRSWKVGETRIGLSKDKGDMALGVNITIPRVSLEEAPYLGVVNSVSRRRSIRFYAGVVSKDMGIVLRRDGSHTKHSKKLDLVEVIKLALDWYREEVKTLGEEMTKLKRAKLSPDEATSYLVEACVRGIIPWRRLSGVGRIHIETTSWDILHVFSSLVALGPVVSSKTERGATQIEKMLKVKEMLAERLRCLVVTQSSDPRRKLWK